MVARRGDDGGRPFTQVGLSQTFLSYKNACRLGQFLPAEIFRKNSQYAKADKTVEQIKSGLPLFYFAKIKLGAGGEAESKKSFPVGKPESNVAKAEKERAKNGKSVCT